MTLLTATEPRRPPAVAAPATERTTAPAHPLSAVELLPPDAFARIRRRMVLDCCKWDPQVGDVSTLAPFPLFIRPRQWRDIATAAERLAAELMAAERELIDRPDLWRRLAIPRRLRGALARIGTACSAAGAVRSMRFDFHWTDEGWRISEVNSDVPGGYGESSAFPRMMAEHVDRARPVGDAGEAWADAMEVAIGGRGGYVAMLAAPGFIEDQQVVGYLARLLARRGFTPHFVDARGLAYGTGAASLSRDAGLTPLAAVVRFYQAEWLARLPRGAWEPLFAGGPTLVTNPGVAVLSESKRFPLVWPELRTPLSTWRQLLPETRDPREVPWRRDEGWLLKSAFCNTGDTVSARSLVTPKRWRAAALAAWWSPGGWVAQRRFRTLPIATPDGQQLYPCVGVYTVNGRAAGAYARLSRGPIVDYRAIDAALLVRDDESANGEERA